MIQVKLHKQINEGSLDPKRPCQHFNKYKTSNIMRQLSYKVSPTDPSLIMVFTIDEFGLFPFLGWITLNESLTNAKMTTHLAD